MNSLKVLYEDNHIIVVEKEPGQLTQGDSSGSPTLIDKVKSYIKKKYDKPGNVFLGMVQRLDKPVSGVMVFARTSKAARRLNEDFRKRNITKIYLAAVHGSAQLEREKWHEIKHYISKNDGYVKIQDQESEDAKRAILKFKILLSEKGVSLFLVKLETGLKHQIRAQLSRIGNSIIGDQKYGSEQKMADASILLHSYFLEFTHPTTKEKIKIISKIPDRFHEVINIEKISQQISLDKINI